MAADDDATATAAAADAAPDKDNAVEDTGDGSREGDVLDILHNGGLIKKVGRVPDRDGQPYKEADAISMGRRPLAASCRGRCCGRATARGPSWATW